MEDSTYHDQRRRASKTRMDALNQSIDKAQKASWQVEQARNDRDRSMEMKFERLRRDQEKAREAELAMEEAQRRRRQAEKDKLMEGLNFSKKPKQ